MALYYHGEQSSASSDATYAYTLPTPNEDDLGKAPALLPHPITLSAAAKRAARRSEAQAKRHVGVAHVRRGVGGGRHRETEAMTATATSAKRSRGDGEERGTGQAGKLYGYPES